MYDPACRWSRSWRKQQWWLCSGYSGGNMTGFFEHKGGQEGMRQDQRNAKLKQEWLEFLFSTPPRVNMCPEADDMCWKFQSMSQPTIPVLGHDYTKVRVPVMWNNKMSAIQDLLNTIPSEGNDPMDSYRWLDRYDQLHYESESIHKYAQGMCVAIPELPEAIEVLMVAADLAIVKLWSLHREHKPLRTVPRIFMVLPSAWVLSNMTQDDNGNDGADDHEDDMQGGSDDSNNGVPEDLNGLCQECSREGRAASCEGEPQQACLQCWHLKHKCSHAVGKHKNPIAPQAAASSSNKCAKPMPPAASLSSSLPPVKVTLWLPHKVINQALHRDPTLEFLTSPLTAPMPSPTIPSPELPIASQS
ncbi:hypothetical protein EDC04DRAFT_2603827 [Pisolithus marmoratus]|nr:hypothetical protein EDC04DRAFT_2603827 [Pisolithus marmoratus]